MKKYVPLLLSSVLAFTSIQSFTVFAEGEDDGNIEEISEEGEEKAVEDTNLRILFTSDLQDHILQYKQADNSNPQNTGYVQGRSDARPHTGHKPRCAGGGAKVLLPPGKRA